MKSIFYPLIFFLSMNYALICSGDAFNSTFIEIDGDGFSKQPLFSIYFCEGHSFIKLSDSKGDVKHVGYYPYGLNLLYLPGKVRDEICEEERCYTQERVDQCQHLTTFITPSQYENLLNYIKTYEGKRRYNVLFNNCVDFSQDCFAHLFPEAGHFVMHFDALTLNSYNGALDKSIFFALLAERGIFSLAGTLLVENLQYYLDLNRRSEKTGYENTLVSSSRFKNSPYFQFPAIRSFFRECVLDTFVATFLKPKQAE